MIETRVKTKITYADGTERTALMSADSAKNLVANACRGDNLGQIKKIEIEYIEDTAAKYRALVAGLSAGITALYQQINTLRAMEIEGTLPAADVKEMIEQNEAAIRECKKYCNHAVQVWNTAKTKEREDGTYTVSEDGTIAKDKTPEEIKKEKVWQKLVERIEKWDREKLKQGCEKEG